MKVDVIIRQSNHNHQCTQLTFLVHNIQKVTSIHQRRERERVDGLTFDLKKEGWKSEESPEIEVSCSVCVLLGFWTLTTCKLGIPTLLAEERERGAQKQKVKIFPLQVPPTRCRTQGMWKIPSTPRNVYSHIPFMHCSPYWPWEPPTIKPNMIFSYRGSALT